LLPVLVVFGFLASGLLASYLPVSSSQAAWSKPAPLRQGPEAGPSADPGTAFGVELTPLDDSGGLQQIIATQTGWARGVVVDWADVEPAQGNIDWGALSAAAGQLDNAFDAGLEPIVVVRGVPQWARLVPNQRCGPIAPDHYDEFGSFIAQVITDYPTPPNPFALVQYWSIWNEPDIDPEDVTPSTSHIGCWGDKDDEFYGGEAYGNMLNTIYPLVKGANDQALLIAGELLLDCDPNNPNVPCDPAPANFLEGILQVSDSFDGISFHAYDYYLGASGEYENLNWDATWGTTGPVLTSKAQFVLDKLAEHQVTGKFIMNTEFALLWDLSSDPALEETKAFYLGQAYASAIGTGLKVNIWYDVTGTWERNNGLLERDSLDPLPAYDAYQFTSAKLGGAVPAAPDFRFGDNVKFYAFDNAVCSNPGNIECSVWVLWSLDGQGTQVTLPADPEQAQDVFGDILPGITQTLTVLVEPYFLEVDAEPPMVHSIEIAPNPVIFNETYTISATVRETATGGSPVASAEYSLDGGTNWSAMQPVDGAFDTDLEHVAASLIAPAFQGSYDYDLCIRGADVWGNVTNACTPITLVVLDNAGPLTVAEDPEAVENNRPLTISATITDSLTGGSIIQSGEYSLDGSGWTPMQPVDGFDTITETVTATLTAPDETGDYELCVRGSDASLNTGEADCTVLTVFSPDGPQVTAFLVDPNPARTNQALSITATIDDSLTGSIPVAQAEYSMDGGATWTPMAAVDGAFDEVSEAVVASTAAPPAPGVYTVCVRGADSNGNLGAPACTDLPVSFYTVNLSMVNRNLYHGGLPPNGDFESGLDFWASNTTYLPVSLATVNPINPVDQLPDQSIPIETGSALLGDPNLPCGNELPFGQDVFVGVEQQVMLPEGSISLEFKYVIYSQDIGYSEETDTYFDTFEVYINGVRQFMDNNNVNDLQCKWHRVPSAENTRPEDPAGWATGSIDLSAYAGQMVTIAFRSYSRYDGWFNTYVYLDDVRIVAGN
jgi:hypothetical protein